MKSMCRTPILAMATVAGLAMFVTGSECSAQNFGQFLEGAVREAVRQQTGGQAPPRRVGPPNTVQPTQQRSFIPSESSGRNNNNRWGGVWGVQPQPNQQVVPREQYRQPQYEQPRYQQPQYQQPYGQPYVQSYDQPSSSTVVTEPPVRGRKSTKKIAIVCRKSQSGSIGYTLISPQAEHPFTIGSGQSQKFQEGLGWKLRYDSGGAGMKTYRLRGGETYSFERDEAGNWQLYQEPEVEEPPVRG